MLRCALAALGRLVATVLFGAVAFLMIPLVLLGATLAFALALVAGLLGDLACLLKETTGPAWRPSARVQGHGWG